MGRGYINVRATGGAVASPFEGGLGGSAPLLVRFLGASEKMNESNFGSFPKEQPSLNLGEDLNTGFLRFDYSNGAI